MIQQGTTVVTINNTSISGYAYTWNQIVTSWDDSLFTWDTVTQQDEPDGVSITQLPTNNITITQI